MRISDWSSDVCSSDLKVDHLMLQLGLDSERGTHRVHAHLEPFRITPHGTCPEKDCEGFAYPCFIPLSCFDQLVDGPFSCASSVFTAAMSGSRLRIVGFRA